MMKKFRRNEKGTVLLTVLCFTTMCLVIAAIALKVSNHSNTQSTNNVMKTQAQITAEHYLEQYLDTFEDVQASNGDIRKNYDPLKTIAGANEASPTKITIAIKQKEGAMSQVNITDGSLEQTAAYGGNCSILVYKAGTGGIVVKAEATYGEQYGVASAYFYGEAPASSLNKNAIETCGGYDVKHSACVAGDILLSNDDPNAITKFKNNNGGYQSNFKTNGNVSNNPETVRFYDTLQGNAPTITSEGFMFFTQLDISTNVGKTDANGKHATDPGYDSSNLLNKNGYLNSAKKIFLCCNKSGNKIGTVNRPIDIYCCGLVIGAIPNTDYSSYNADDAKAFKTSIENAFGTTDRDGSIQLYGNIYCYKGVSGNMADDGDFVCNLQNSPTIHGDLVVDGNICIGCLVDGSGHPESCAKLKVDGDVYCTGTYDASKIELTAGHSIHNTLPSNQRAQKPAMNYSPGLYVYGVLDNPTITDPQNYKSQTPAHMYAQNDEKTKYFKTNYLSALNYTLGDSYSAGNPVSTGYTGDDVFADQNADIEITINKSCRLTPTQLRSTLTDKQAVKYKVNVTTSDIWVLLPAYADGTGTVTPITYNARFMVNNPENGHHCYFVFYRYDPAQDYTTEDGKKYAEKFYTNGTGSGYDSEVNIQPYDLHGAAAVFTKQFVNTFDKSKKNPDNPDAKTNIVFLVPDDFKFDLTKRGSGQYSKFQCVVFGPYCDFEININEGSKVYGQVKVDNYYVDESAQIDESAHFCDLSDDSILHTYLTQASSTGGIINLQYFIKHQ